MKKITLILSILFIGLFSMQVQASPKAEKKTAESIYAFAESMETIDLDLLKSEMVQLSTFERIRLANMAIKDVRHAQATGNLASGNIALYILAVIIPPVAVAIHTNLGMPTVWNILWTLLGWVPGIIHAFIIIA